MLSILMPNYNYDNGHPLKYYAYTLTSSTVARESRKMRQLLGLGLSAF